MPFTLALTSAKTWAMTYIAGLMYHNQNFKLGTQSGIACHSKPNITQPFTHTRGNRNKRTATQVQQQQQQQSVRKPFNCFVIEQELSSDTMALTTENASSPCRGVCQNELQGMYVSWQSQLGCIIEKTNENSIFCA